MSYEKAKKAAIKLAAEYGLINLNRGRLAEELGILPNSFYAFAGCNFTELVAELESEGHLGPQDASSPSRASSPTMRKMQILNVAVSLAAARGYANLSRGEVAEAAGVSVPLVSKHFRSLGLLKQAVMEHAIQNEILPLIAQGLANKHELVINASEELKEKALLHIAAL